MLECKQCGSTDKVGPRTKLCKKCVMKRKSEYTSKRYYSKPEKVRTMYNPTCICCNNNFISFRKTSLLCSDCIKEKKKLDASHQNTNNYIYNKEAKLVHRVLVEDKLNRILTYNEVVHHLDDNPKNNILSNLIVFSRSNHIYLHKHLSLQRFLMYKKESNLDNWNKNIVDITSIWLHENKVEYISFIGAS